jgi:PAP2 superfamily C-terminal
VPLEHKRAAKGAHQEGTHKGCPYAAREWVQQAIMWDRTLTVASTDTMRSNSGRALAVRLVATGIAIGFWFWTQSLISRRNLTSSGIGDGLQFLSAPLNRYLVLHPHAANGLLIASSGLIDLLAVFVFAEWVFGRSVRPLLGLAILLGLRQLVQGLCALPKPDNMIWHYPGFPSLLVTYSVSNDFFFSAHTAIAVFAATEIARLGRRWLTLLAVVIVVFEAAAVLVLRAHYTMDIFTAIIAALYVAYLTERISPPLDRTLAKYLAPADEPRSREVASSVRR